MKFNYLFLFITLLFFGPQSLQAQDEENWGVYMAIYENDLPGSAMLRMDLISQAPIKNYEYVLIAGIEYETVSPNGLPEGHHFQLFGEIEDGLNELLRKLQKEYYYVGAFTLNGERLEYFYLVDPTGVEEAISAYFKEQHPDVSYDLAVNEDAEWDTYINFLYPNDEVINYMSDMAVVDQLIEAGDDLSEERRVDHWLFFPTEKEKTQFLELIAEDGFEVEHSEEIENEGETYILLQIFRTDFVDLQSINTVSSSLVAKAKQANGDYDGWETFVIKE